jgi:hypothetical protein
MTTSYCSNYAQARSIYQHRTAPLSLRPMRAELPPSDAARIGRRIRLDSALCTPPLGLWSLAVTAVAERSRMIGCIAHVRSSAPPQGVELEAHCEKGIGTTHAKWSPVATASYRLLPTVEFLEPIEVAAPIRMHACRATHTTA